MIRHITNLKISCDDSDEFDEKEFSFNTQSITF